MSIYYRYQSAQRRNELYLVKLPVLRETDAHVIIDDHGRQRTVRKPTHIKHYAHPTEVGAVKAFIHRRKWEIGETQVHIAHLNGMLACAEGILKEIEEKNSATCI